MGYAEWRNRADAVEDSSAPVEYFRDKKGYYYKDRDGNYYRDGEVYVPPSLPVDVDEPRWRYDRPRSLSPRAVRLRQLRAEVETAEDRERRGLRVSHLRDDVDEETFRRRRLRTLRALRADVVQAE